MAEFCDTSREAPGVSEALTGDVMKDAVFTGFFDELTKIGAVSDYLLGKAVGTSLRHPLLVRGRYRKTKDSVSKHKQMMHAVEHGSPAGWVSMGMRPE